MSHQFEATAVKLSQGPLGIIALFIVLIHGFASLVLGLANDISEENSSRIVWFLVSFPVLVFFVFAWLVSQHHAKLYPPQACRDEGYFVNLAFGHASFDSPDLQKPAHKKWSSPIYPLKTGLSGNLFWLGHDLMWSADVLLRKGPSEQVLIGLDQARHHLIQLGLGDTPFEHEVRTLTTLIEQSTELSSVLRNEYASQLGSLIDRIGMSAEAGQALFVVPPHWKRMRN